ncbi:hypothetical protein D3C71_2249190 [compost metagenome]
MLEKIRGFIETLSELSTNLRFNVQLTREVSAELNISYGEVSTGIQMQAVNVSEINDAIHQVDANI